MSDPAMTATILQRMARAAYEKHPLRKIAFKNNVIEAPPIEWEALDDFERGMLLNAQRAALQAMIDAVQAESDRQGVKRAMDLFFLTLRAPCVAG